MAVDSGRSAGNLGAGGERNFFCGDVAANAQPRNHAAAAVVSDLHPGRASDGRGHAVILTGEGAARFWIVLLPTYDLVFTTACLALFEKILHAE